MVNLFTMKNPNDWSAYAISHDTCYDQIKAAGLHTDAIFGVQTNAFVLGVISIAIARGAVAVNKQKQQKQ